MAVEGELEKLGLVPKSVRLGEVTLERELSKGEREGLERQLIPLGFELIDDKKSRNIEKIKKLIIELVHYSERPSKFKLSDYISEGLGQDYNTLSKLFTEIEGTTIEKFFIAQRIEKAKELLAYDELSLGEIAHRLNYSSAAYLANQFKKVTGLTPGHFKRMGQQKRLPLDKV